MVPPPGLLPISAELLDDFARVRAHLRVEQRAEVFRADVVRAVDELGSPVPIEVLALLTTLGRSPDLPQKLLDELDEFYRAKEQPQWRQSAGFSHLPFWAEGDWPRTYACAQRNAPARGRDSACT